MDAQHTATELRHACESFKQERISLSAVERFLNAVELVADRLAGDNVIPIPQHRLNGSTS